jgi:PIN domain nuclease of toxin-antitoxin system
MPIRDWLERLVNRSAVSVEPISVEIAALAHTLGFVHRDPFDRLIVATAYALGCPLVTADGPITDSGLVKVIW